MNNTITIYTDGSCLGNPGPGGWAFVISFNGRERLVAGGENNVTNNKMELKAFLEAIKAVDNIKAANQRIEFFIDSQYVIKGCTEWQKNWLKNNFKTKAKGGVKNKELWEQILPIYNINKVKHQINLNWVKGHSGNYLNDKVDRAAYAEAERIKHGG